MMRSVLIAMLLGCLPLACYGAEEVPASVLQQEEQRIAAIAKGVQSAICIFANEGSGGGSGVVISADGYALTNFHVTEPAGTYMKCSMSDGNLYDAVLVGIDPTGDVSLIKLLGREDFVPAVLADSETVQMGDFCYAVGNPFLLATDFQPTVTMGLVSGTHRYQYPSGTLIEYADCIQTDTSINPGNSGGALFNMQGEVIGINGRVSFEKRVRVNMGVGYAISINQIKKFMGALRGGRIVDHATLGARIATGDDGRILVADILEDSDAYAKGLRVDDEILAFGGRVIRSSNMFKNLLGTYPKGWRVPLTYRQGDQTISVTVRLAGVHGEEELAELVEREKGPTKPEGKPQKPEGKDPNKKPAEKPEGQKPQDGAHGKEPVIPEIVKNLIKARHGYANYYFNELEQKRVWQNAIQKQGDFTAQTGAWHLVGKLADGTVVDVTLSDAIAEAKVGDEVIHFDLTSEWANQLEEAVHSKPKDPKSNVDRATVASWLSGLSMWRSLLVAGPSKFGDLYYYGTLAWGEGESQSDMLVGTRSVVEGHFVFEPQAEGKLSAMEVFPDVDLESCLVSFQAFQTQDKFQLPRQLTVQRTGKPAQVIVWDTMDLGASVPAAAEANGETP